MKLLLPLIKISKLSKQNAGDGYQQQFRSPTSRTARGMKEIGLDSLDLCPTGLGELVYLRFRVIPWLSVVKNPPRFANKMDRPIDFI